MNAYLTRLRCIVGSAIATVAIALAPAARANVGGVPAIPDNHPTFSAIHVMGDSLSDTGRSSAVLTQALGVPFPPPPYATGRMCNGPLWIEYFSPMVRRAYEPRTNYAWAGATSGIPNVLTAEFGVPLPGMSHQISDVIPTLLPTPDKKALYVVFGGSNDFLQLLTPPGANPQTVITNGVTNLVTYVATIRAFGGENIVIFDVPDVGLTPRARAGGLASAQAATQLSIAFNQALNQALDQLGFRVCRVSTFNLLNQFAAQPKKFGFTNVTGMGRADLANADTYLFWDDVHTTTRAHRYLAEEAFLTLAANGMLRNLPK
jgi:phospholipase/lecithinase/hemolysin